MEKFSDRALIRLDLARYACKLDRLKQAMKYLEGDIASPSKLDIRQMALDDLMPEPLWADISQI